MFHKLPHSHRLLAICLLTVTPSACVLAQDPAPLALADVFGDHMVLQRQIPAAIWGTGPADADITVTFAGQTASTRSDPRGNWRCKLAALTASATGRTLTVSAAGQSVRISDVLVGEVWLASGQSNIAWTIAQHKALPKYKRQVAQANLPSVRTLTVAHQSARLPYHRVNASWTILSPETVEGISATGYFFAKSLHEQLHVPVGLLIAAVEGRHSQCFTSPKQLKIRYGRFEDRIKRVARFEKNLTADLPKKLDAYLASEEASKTWTTDQAKSKIRQEMLNWAEASIAAEAAGKPAPPSPTSHWGLLSATGAGGDPRFHRPAGLFHGMVVPLAPYTIRGVVWYQGEADADWKVGRDYRKSLACVIQSYRTLWKQRGASEALPFVFAQLANYTGRKGDNAKSWIAVRDGMRIAAEQIDQAWMTVLIDVNQPEQAANIHPQNKPLVGARLVRTALAKVYGKDMLASGPMVRSAVAQPNGTIQLHFDQVGQHLQIGPQGKGKKLTTFQWVDEAGKTAPAEAKLDGKTVLLEAPVNISPLTVRYGWQLNPPAELYNSQALPASPFEIEIQRP